MNEQSSMMNQQQQQQQQLIHMNQMNPHPPPQMLPMNRNYVGMWPPQFQNPNPNPNLGSMKPPVSGFVNSLGPRNNWKGKRTNNNNNKINDKRRNDQLTIGGGTNVVNNVANTSYSSGYQPPLLNELQQQNRLKARKFFPKKKFNNNNKNNNNSAVMNNNMGGNVGYFKGNRSAPFAPRNTSSFLIRAKKSGGIAPLVSPCPVTPAVLPTPIFSPSKEVLVDMAKEEWGVDGYGSMKGLIRLRSEALEDEEEDEGGSSESDVEERVEVERRLDHDLSRFEMIYDPSNVGGGGMEYNNVLENRVDDQDSRIAQLEEENLIMKERLFLIEREFADLRRRMQSLGRRNGVAEFNEEVVENESENDSESRDEARSMEENVGDFSEDTTQGEGYVSSKRKGIVGEIGEGLEETMGVEKYDVLETEEKTENDDNSLVVAADKNFNVVDVEGKGENNNFQFTEANKIPDKNENDSVIKANTTENVAVVGDLDGKLKAVGNAGVESSDLVMLEGNVQVEQVESASDSIALEK